MLQIINNFLGILILNIGEIFFARIVLDKKINVGKTKLIIIYLLSSIILTIDYILFKNTIKTLIICIIHMIEFKLLFNLDFSKAIFLTFICTIVLMLPDIMQLLIATKILGISKEIFYDKYAGSIIANITMCILFIMVTLLLRKPLKKLLKTEISDNTKIIVLSIFTFICITIFFYIFASKFRIDGNSIPYLLAILVFSVVLFSLIKQTIDNYKLTSEYDKLLEFMTTYENEIENQRILRHEVKNEFRTIRAKICDKQENKEIIEYIDEIVKDKYEVDKEKYAKFGYLPPNGIKGLFYFKTQEAEKRNINVAINISKKVKNSIVYNLNIKQQRDFGRIIGVILDNAIEASAETEKKQIGIEAYVNLESEFKLIVSNTFNNNIEENKIGKEKFSTKGKNRGHGLLLVKQLVNKNDIFELETQLQEELYIQMIKVKKL